MILYLICFCAFLLLGIPVALSLGLASLAYLFATDNLMLLLAFPQKMISGIDNFVLLTIPFFILAGNLMNSAQLTQYIVKFAQVIVGQIKGGLAAVNLVASLMFSGVSGAATAEASALGSVMIPAMKRDGYRVEYSAAVTAVGSLLGPLIPPSLALILYGVLTGTSIGDLFMAGIVPAFVLCGLLITYVLYKARRENHPLSPVIPASERRGLIGKALPALLMPFIIVGGIKSGVFTPTEAAAVAATYALVIGLFLYRTLNFQRIRQSFYEAATMSAGVMLVVSMASITSFLMSIENIPVQIADALLSITQSPFFLLLLLNVILLILGLFLEPLAALVLAMPILNQVFPILEIDPVQFGVMVVLNLMIGMVTPPVGLCLFIVSTIGRVSLEKVSWAALPMIAICLLVLMLVVFVPGLTLTLPGLIGAGN